MNIMCFNSYTISFLANIFTIGVPFILGFWFLYSRYLSRFEDIMLNDLPGNYGYHDLIALAIPDKKSSSRENIGAVLFITQSNKNGSFFGYMEQNSFKIEGEITTNISASIFIIQGNLMYNFLDDYCSIKIKINGG